MMTAAAARLQTYEATITVKHAVSPNPNKALLMADVSWLTRSDS